LPTLPIQYILNTTYRPDHTGGNDVIAKAGRRLVDADSEQAVILAHESILNRMSAPDGRVPPRPVPAWPTDTFFTQRKEVYFNGEPAILHHRPGTTDGDTYVHFRRSDVIVAGDLYINTTFPRIDVESGGHINGILQGLNDLLEEMISVNNVEDGTLVIPAYGRVADELDVAEYRDMVTIMRDRVQDAVTRGVTLAQLKADRTIALEYEERYGGKGGPWTTEMFLEAVYKNLTAAPKGKS
jgi:cyclase